MMTRTLRSVVLGTVLAPVVFFLGGLIPPANASAPGMNQEPTARLAPWLAKNPCKYDVQDNYCTSLPAK